MLEIELFDHLTVCIHKLCLQTIYLIYMWKQALDLITHESWYAIKPNFINTDVWFDVFGISTFVGYLMPMPSLQKNSNGTT